VNFARTGAEYTGADLSETSLDLARRRFEMFGLTGSFILANGEELAEVGKYYDAVHLESINHQNKIMNS